MPERVRPLTGALGCVLAEPVLADRDSPAADRSAMDGYAVRAADLTAGQTSLNVIGEVAAGSPARPTVLPGSCARIFTGANLPPGADAVVPVEDTRADAPDRVVFAVPIAAGANILRKGENARRGEILVPAGTTLGAGHLTVAASAGHPELRVRDRPKVAVITTGRELLDPSAQPSDHQERDSNQTLILASLAAAGFLAMSAERVSDERAAVTDCLRAALRGADAVVLSGGVSVGAYDFVPAAVSDVGARTLIHGVRMKPGKPFLFALAPEDRPIFGLPGNPLSAAVGLHEFVLPALRRMSGIPEPGCRPIVRARLRERIVNKPGRDRYVLAALSFTPLGPEVAAIASQSSADVVAGARADGTIVVPADVGTVEADALVDFRPWRSWP
jgi:molybdopterin molybdotransferase